MEGEVRYCTTDDGVRIAYTVLGEGPPLVMAPFFIESFSLEHLYPVRQPFMEDLGRGRTIVRYDQRGTGLSDREVEDLSLPALTSDLEAVVRAAALERFALFAGVNGTQVAITFVAKHPAKIHRLILADPIARLKDGGTEEFIKSFAEMARGNWPLAAQTLADLRGRKDFPEVTIQLADWWRESSSGESVSRLILENLNNDVYALLPQVKAPTLILYSLGISAEADALRQRVAAALPNTRTLARPRSHFILEVGDPEIVLRAIHDFLDEGTGRKTSSLAVDSNSGAFRTILFTDMEGSTSLTQRLGDAAAQDVLRTHNSIVRDALAAHSGTEIKHTGDGIMASFTTASAALGAAVAIQKALADHNEANSDAALRVRIGLNAGEPVAEDEDLFGTAVQLAARVCDKAEPGQILASNVVQELAAGKGFDFADQGEASLKGFDKPVRLHEVRWRD